jgi:hypothetical protein
VDPNWEKVKSFLDQLGGVAERSNAAVSKTVTRHSAGREFESPPLRSKAPDPAPLSGISVCSSAAPGRVGWEVGWEALVERCLKDAGAGNDQHQDEWCSDE